MKNNTLNFNIWHVNNLIIPGCYIIALIIVFTQTAQEVMANIDSIREHVSLSQNSPLINVLLLAATLILSLNVSIFLSLSLSSNPGVVLARKSYWSLFSISTFVLGACSLYIIRDITLYFFMYKTRTQGRDDTYFSIASIMMFATFIGHLLITFFIGTTVLSSSEEAAEALMEEASKPHDDE